MINIPVSEIIAKIAAEKGLSGTEIRRRIDEKLHQLAGLISEDGAAHIVANELGVELIATRGDAKIRDLYAGMRAVTVPGRVTRKFDVRHFDKGDRKGKVAAFLLGDETGTVRVTLWNNQADLLETFAEGDIVKVKNAYVKENRGFKELHLNQESSLETNPPGVTVGELARETRPARERKQIKELTGDEENVELLATVVQVYDPRFFDVCPECNKRVAAGSQHAPQGVAGGAQCPTHGVVSPQTNYVLSAFLDDGTGTIRATFWKQQAQRLTGKEDASFLHYQQNPAGFEEVKQELLGTIIKVVGRCKKNDTFDRVELTANLVFTDVDPEEELARIKQESASGVAKIDAPAPVKAAIKQVLEKPAERPPKRSVVEEERFGTDALSGDAEEDLISLDDLEDLDEKL